MTSYVCQVLLKNDNLTYTFSWRVVNYDLQKYLFYVMKQYFQADWDSSQFDSDILKSIRNSLIELLVVHQRL